MAQTKMSAAMQAAGIPTADVRLYVAGCEAMRLADKNVKVAVRMLASQSKGDAALLFALAEYYLLTRVSPDMGGRKDFVRSGHSSIGEIVRKSDAAPHGPVEDDGGLGDVVSATTGMPPSSSPSESDGGQMDPASAPTHVPPSLSPDEDRAGHTLRAPSAGGHLPALSSPDDDGTGRKAIAAKAGCRLPLSSSPVESAGAMHGIPQGRFSVAPAFSPIGHNSGDTPNDLPDGAGQKPVAQPRAALPAPVRKPNAPRGLAAMAFAQREEHRALFDTYKVRGGLAIGDLTLGEAKRIASTNEREAAILRRVVEHVGYAEGGTAIRDLIRPEKLAEFIKSVEG